MDSAKDLSEIADVQNGGERRCSSPMPPHRIVRTHGGAFLPGQWTIPLRAQPRSTAKPTRPRGMNRAITTMNSP